MPDLPAEEKQAPETFIDRLTTVYLPDEEALNPFPELVPGLPVIHLALVNVATGSVLYPKQTTRADHAAWFKESYEQQAKNEDPGFVFYSGQLLPEDHIAAEQAKLVEDAPE